MRWPVIPLQTDIGLLPLPSWSSKDTWATFENGNFHGVFRGVEVQKSDDDLERYREAIVSSQPDFIVETGTRAGGSAMWFWLEMGVRVITIDISPQWMTRGRPPYRGNEIEWVVGSSISDSAIEHARAATQGARVMVSLDSDHHSAHVQAEIAMLGTLVTPGCHLVVEDACFDMWDPDRARIGGGKIPEHGGPLHAINMQRRLLESTGFQRDTAIEGLTPISHSPVGWWRLDD
jgi:cephalosporin hydroxylase